MICDEDARAESNGAVGQRTRRGTNTAAPLSGTGLASDTNTTNTVCMMSNEMFDALRGVLCAPSMLCRTTDGHSGCGDAPSGAAQAGSEELHPSDTYSEYDLVATADGSYVIVPVGKHGEAGAKYHRDRHMAHEPVPGPLRPARDDADNGLCGATLDDETCTAAPAAHTYTAMQFIAHALAWRQQQHQRDGGSPMPRDGPC